MAKKVQLETRFARKLRLERKSMLEFMQNPKPHLFEPGFSPNTCIRCKLEKQDQIHFRSHKYQRNYDSTLRKCLCGLSKSNSIHARTI